MWTVSKSCRRKREASLALPRLKTVQEGNSPTASREWRSQKPTEDEAIRADTGTPRELEHKDGAIKDDTISMRYGVGDMKSSYGTRTALAEHHIA